MTIRTGDLELVKVLEKETGIKLKPQNFGEMLKSKSSGYSKDEEGNVDGICLYGGRFSSLPGSLARFEKLRKLALFSIVNTDYTLLREMKQLYFLDLTSNSIEDISFLTGLTNLTDLYLGWTQPGDISPLQSLTGLTSLDLRDNKLTDISPLGALNYLNVLDLRNNELTDISSLQGKNRLSYLNLTGNKIVDLNPLRESSRLMFLEVEDNQVEQISSLKDLTGLTYINCAGNRITNVSALLRLMDLTILNLKGNNITDISPLKTLRNLTDLDLSENNITDIAPLQWLRALTHLKLRKNRISDIMPLESLNELVSLSLSNNQITDISPLKMLKNVFSLGLGMNEVTDISPLRELENLIELSLEENQLADISALQNLIQLAVLDLNDNRISDISALNNLTLLTHLYLNDNQLSDISALENLTQLTHLYLNYNQLSDISALNNLIQLTHLYLCDNQLSDISALKGMANLKRLDLGNNRITLLPVDVARWGMEIKWEYEQISYGMYLEGNPLKTPPVEIVKIGTEAVQDYFKELKRETVRLMECKILIVGNGEVGKTSLMKKLIDNSYQLEEGKEPTTHGIHIKPWTIKCPFNDCDEDDEFNVRFWDFGGQSIYHATHQFFLTKRSLYIFVWEARKEEEVQTFDYWLNIIKLLGRESPVIVVMNKSDLRIKHLDEATLKRKFNNIVSFIKVSCKTGEGIQELTEHISSALAGMPYLKEKFPKAWFDIRRELRVIGERKNYISINDYYDICGSYGLDEEGADVLRDYLHDLEGILYVGEDPFLDRTIILNPEWATEAVYKLIDTREIYEHKGRFAFDDLKRFWNPEKYPPEKHRELLQLMEKFELCFNIAGTEEYIIPELLPPIQPSISLEEYSQPGCLRFQYRYDFMPGGILSRFISRSYYLVKNEQYWKSGVLPGFGDSSALVASDPLNRSTTISVTGASPFELMAIIRNQLDTIHRTLNMEKGVLYSELVPCNCTVCRKTREPYFYNYDVLNRRRLKGIDETVCEYSDESVSIPLLLKGYKPPVPTKPSALPAQIVSAVGHLMSIAKSLKPYEGDRNDLLALLLTVKGILVKDKSRSGLSASTKSIGIPDFKFSAPDGSVISFMEAFNLRSFDKSIIDLHLKKLFNYNTAGVKQNYILVYAETKNFTGSWRKYLEYLPEIDFEYPLRNVEALDDLSASSNIKVARASHLRNESETYVYHIFVHMKGD